MSTKLIIYFFKFLEFAERRCSAEGQWESRPGTNTTTGWTNYTPCYIPEVLQLFRKLGNEDEAKVRKSLEALH